LPPEVPAAAQAEGLRWLRKVPFGALQLALPFACARGAVCFF
jgi:hypothetical protein